MNKIEKLYNEVIEILEIKDEIKFEVANLDFYKALGICYTTEFKGMKKSVIKISPDCPESELLDTICHEIAHIKYINHNKSHRNLTKEYFKKVKFKLAA